MSVHKCKFCGVDADYEPLYHDWPFGKLGDNGMYCWRCYHVQCIRQNKAAFSLSEVGDNSGGVDSYLLANAILEALDMTEDNLDKGIGIDAQIGSSYTSSLIVRSGVLYAPVADLLALYVMEQEARLSHVQKLIKTLKWTVQRVRFPSADTLLQRYEEKGE